MARKEIGNSLDRENRNNHNDNYTELFKKLDEINVGKGYLGENEGVDYPLRNMKFKNDIGTISEAAKNAILDVKVFGAKIDRYYKLTMIANGYESNGKQRWGISLVEYEKENFDTLGKITDNIFLYNNDEMLGNEGNANYQKGSDGIDTITVDNGEIACSVTVDRNVISSTGNGLFMNLNNPHAPTAIIDPSNYFF